MNVAIALLSIVLCWLSLTEAQTADQQGKDGPTEDQRKTKPRAILHIGPDKTGTTSVQGMLASAETRSVMKKLNTYWLPHSETRMFVWELAGLHAQRRNAHGNMLQLVTDREFESYAQMGRFLNKSRSLGHNVLLSSEFFSWLPAQKIRRVQDLLQGFDVTVISVYREYLSHMISKIGEENKMLHSAGHHQPFAKHLMAMDSTHRSRDYLTTLGEWSQVFGKDALQIVDYYGAIEAGKSVPLVVLCEVAGVLCDAKEEAVKNVSEEHLMQQVLTYFYHFFAMQPPGPWHPCESNLQPPHLVAFFKKAFQNRGKELLIPTLQSNLTFLVGHSAAWDLQLREAFGPHILYPSAPANLARARGNHVEDIDSDEMRRNAGWTQWMRKVFDHAVRLRLLCK